MTTVKVFYRPVYGNPTIYPADEFAALFCKLTGRKTLRTEDLEIVAALGFAVEVVPDPRLPGKIFGGGTHDKQ